MGLLNVTFCVAIITVVLLSEDSGFLQSLQELEQRFYRVTQKHVPWMETGKQCVINLIKMQQQSFGNFSMTSHLIDTLVAVHQDGDVLQTSFLQGCGYMTSCPTLWNQLTSLAVGINLHVPPNVALAMDMIFTVR